MRQLPEIYNANASIIVKDNKKFKDSTEVKWQYLFTKDVGTSEGFQNKVLRLNKRIRSYGRSIFEDQVDFNWDVHKTIQSMALEYPKEDTVWIGTARDMATKDNPYVFNERLYFMAGLLHKPYDADFYTLKVFMMDKTFKLRLNPQNNKNYPYRGDWHSDEVVGQKMGGKWGW